MRISAPSVAAWFSRMALTRLVDLPAPVFPNHATWSGCRAGGSETVRSSDLLSAVSG
jgi:hypothetical protein